MRHGSGSGRTDLDPMDHNECYQESTEQYQWHLSAIWEWCIWGVNLLVSIVKYLRLRTIYRFDEVDLVLELLYSRSSSQCMALTTNQDKGFFPPVLDIGIQIINFLRPRRPPLLCAIPWLVRFLSDGFIQEIVSSCKGVDPPSSALKWKWLWL
jgi:hypothetical protein